MSGATLERTALLIIDMQNDFLHADGAYARGGAVLPAVESLVANVKNVADAVRAAGGWIISTQFTLVPGRGGEPIVSPHLKKLRPFLRKGDFLPGSWGHQLVEELQPADLTVEKVAYSAFYMSRLEWLLRKAGIDRLIVCGIVTNGGVASTARDAHVRDFEVTILTDCCAAFSSEVHETALGGLKGVGRLISSYEMLEELGGRSSQRNRG